MKTLPGNYFPQFRHALFQTRNLTPLPAVRASLPVLAALCLFASAIAAEARSGAASSPNIVHGIVSDQKGAPLPLVQIQIRTSIGKIAAALLSAADGSFRIELPGGKYLLTATLAGFRPVKDYPIEVTEPSTHFGLTLEASGIEEQIVVTATKTEAPLSQVGSGVTVISGKQLAEEGAMTIADALRRVAGLTLVQSGGYGQVTSLFVRGGGSNYTKVLIDGIPVNDPGGSFNFANLSTAGIDRIEVVRGPQSALFGSDAIAGVVQIFTLRGAHEGLVPAPHASVEAGTYATYSYSGGLEGKTERFDYTASFARLDTDNNVRNGSFSNATVSANVGWRPSKTTELRGIIRSEAGRAGVPGQWAFYRPDPEEFFRRKDIDGSFTFAHHATQSWTQLLSYTIADSRQFSQDPVDSGSFVPEYLGRKAPYPSFDFVYSTLNQTRRQRLNYQSDLSLRHGHFLTVGGDFERESGIIGDPAMDPLRAVRDNAAAYVQDQWSVHNRFFTTAGLRLDHNGNFGFYATPRLSLAYQLRQTTSGFWGLTKLKGNFGLGIKEPSLIESYSQSPYFRGNPDLRPEKSVGFDAGVEQYLGNGRGMFDIAWFDNRYRDQIGFITTNYSTFEGTFFNLGKTRARGVETTARCTLTRELEIGGGYTYLNSRVLESAVDFDPAYAKGQELLRRPRHSGYIDIRWKPGRWMLGATSILMGSRVDSDFSGLGITRNLGYGILNLSASLRLPGNLALYSVVENALDKNYMEVLGYPALRRHFRVGLRYGQ